MWSDDQTELLTLLEGKLNRVRGQNRLKGSYYDGTAAVDNLGIAVPKSLENVRPVLGWPATVVDVLAERLDFRGFTIPGDEEATAQFALLAARSSLMVELQKAITDSLIYGIGFLAVTEDYGAPDARAVDPLSASFVWDDSGRRVRAGLVVNETSTGVRLRTLYLPDATVVERVGDNGTTTVETLEHNRGIAGLVPITNRVRSGKAKGHTEISEAVRYATDNGVRTLLGMEYNREFYTTPQRYAEDAYPETIGMSEDNRPEENRKAAWKASMSSFGVFPPTEVEDGQGDVTYRTPKVGQFAASPPTPYIEQLRALTQIIAAESSIPVHYLGFVTDNPSSADAIRQAEARLVKKSELRQRQLTQVLVSMVAPLLWVIDTGVKMSPQMRSHLDAMWVDASTPTRAAMADAAVKIVGAGVAPPRSTVIYNMLGISPTDQRRLEADWARDTSRALVGDLADRAAKARAQSAQVDSLARATTEGEAEQSADTGGGSG